MQQKQTHARKYKLHEKNDWWLTNRIKNPFFYNRSRTSISCGRMNSSKFPQLPRINSVLRFSCQVIKSQNTNRFGTKNWSCWWTERITVVAEKRFWELGRRKRLTAGGNFHFLISSSNWFSLWFLLYYIYTHMDDE